MTTTAPTKMITEKQADFIRTLKAEVGIEVDEDGLGSLTRKQASHMIDSLIDYRDRQRAEAKAAEAQVYEDPEVADAEGLHDEIPDGYYTVVIEDEGHRTFRIKTAGANSNLAGKRIISFLSGSNNESDYTGFGFVFGTEVKIWKRFSEDSTLAEAAKVLVGDPSGSQKMYAMVSGNCYVCGRTLTDPTSIELGIGPICRAD